MDTRDLSSSASLDSGSAGCAHEKKTSSDNSKEAHTLKILRADDIVIDRKPYRREEETDLTCKLLLVGEHDSGKTMFLSRGFENSFSIQHKFVTPLDMSRKIYDLFDPEDSTSNRINVQIWDITCGEAFSCIIASQYRDVQGVFLCYSVYDRQSYNSLPTFLEQIRTYGQHNPCILLLGLQADVKPMSQQEVGCYRYSHHHRRKTGSELKALERAVSYEEGEAFARSHGLLFMEVSSKDDFQIQDAIVSLVYMVLRRVKREGMRYVAHRPAERGRDGGFGRSGNEAMSKQGQRCLIS